MKKIKHVRLGDQRRGELLLDGAHDFGGIARRFEDDRGSEQRWYEQSHELSKDVAQWNEGDEAQGVKPTLVLPILFDATLQWLQVRQKISVRQNNSARFRRRARSVQNFGSGASLGLVARINAGAYRWSAGSHDIFQVVDDH